MKLLILSLAIFILILASSTQALKMPVYQYYGQTVTRSRTSSTIAITFGATALTFGAEPLYF